MLRHFVGPIAQGFGVFLLTAAALLLPYLIWQYRRWGRVGPARVLAQSTFLPYLLCAWAVVLLPFPDPATLSRPAPVNLVANQWWSDAVDAAHRAGGGWRAWLFNPPLLVRVFNVVLTVPLGVYFRRWFRRGLWTTALAGLGLSLAFELTQLSAVWGLYPMPYRQFDVDDLIANTAGAVLGWVLAPLVVLLPARHRHDDVPVPGRPSVPRRLTAVVVDAICWVAAYLVVLLMVVVVTAGVEYDAGTVAVSVWTLTFGLVFVLVPALADGATPGRALLRLGVRDSTGAGVPWWRYLVREVVLWWPVAVVPDVAWWVHDAVPDRPGATLAVVVGAPLGWLLLLGLIALARRDRRSLPDLVARTRVTVGAGT